VLTVLRPASALGSWLVAASAISDLCSLAFFRSGGVRDRFGKLAGAHAGGTSALLSDMPIPLWNAMNRTLPPLLLVSGVGSALSILNVTPLNDDEHSLVDRLGLVVDLVELGVTIAAEREASQVAEVGAALKEGPGARWWKLSTYLTVSSVGLALLPIGGRFPRLIAGVLGTGSSIALKTNLFEAGKASARNSSALFQRQDAQFGATEGP
jgi:hypothetical protein